jgi:glycogen debranching enzyme
MIELPLTQVPFSAYGAWMSISPIRRTHHAPDDASALYLRSHHGKTTTLLRLEPTGQSSSTIAVTATPTLLRWTQGTTWIEVCFDGLQLRLRGQGMGLRLTPEAHDFPALMYQVAVNIVTFNILEARRQYRIECLRGELRTENAWQANLVAPGLLECHADAHGLWEIALNEFESTWNARQRDPFETCQSRNEQSFNAWLEATLPAPERFAKSRILAAYINWSMTVSPCGLLERPTMLMSKNWMSSIWSWDHCFNALAHVHTQPQLAWDQMLVMIDHQDEHGCYPDAINDVERIFNFTKPPVHGLMVGWLLERDAPPRDTLERVYDSLCRWTNFWLTHRQASDQALPHYLHGNDSGWDNSTMFDQGVPLIGPDLAAFLIAQLEVQANIATRLEKSLEAQHWQHKAKRLLEHLLELWQGDHFAAQLPNGHLVHSSSLQHHLPIILGQRLPEPIRHALVKNICAHLTPWGLATELTDSPAFENDGYWRGPIWAPSSYLIAQGLHDIGETNLAMTIAERFCTMCDAHGFAENFNALTGVGLRDKAYTWTASVFMLFSQWLVQSTSAENARVEVTH